MGRAVARRVVWRVVKGLVNGRPEFWRRLFAVVIAGFRWGDGQGRNCQVTAAARSTTSSPPEGDKSGRPEPLERGCGAERGACGRQRWFKPWQRSIRAAREALERGSAALLGLRAAMTTKTPT